MSNAINGAHIKAWAGPNVGGGSVKNITFDGFVETNVANPVIIEQVRLHSNLHCYRRHTINFCSATLPMQLRALNSLPMYLYRTFGSTSTCTTPSELDF